MKITKEEVLTTIRIITAEQGYPPTFRQIAEETGLAPSAIFYRVGQLRKEGLLEARPGTARTIILSPTGTRYARKLLPAIDSKAST